MSGDLAWFRFYSEAVDDEKLRLIAFEDRWHFVALLCCKAKGLLDVADEPGLVRRKIAVKLGVQVRELEEIARRLAEVGLIDAETLQPLAWDSRQFVSDSSTERARKCRERKKKNNATDLQRCCNVTATPPETDTDTDTDKKIGGSNVADPPPKPKPEAIPWQRIVESFNATLTRLPKVRELTAKRKTMIRRAWHESAERQTAEFWAAYWQSCEDDPFLNGTGPYGNGHENWRPDFDYLIRSETVTRIVERVVHGARMAA